MVEIRRHAERADRQDEQSALSGGGRAMCRRLAQVAMPHALVMASPLVRARETAEIITGRLDRVEARLLPDLHGLPFGFWDGLTDLTQYADLTRRNKGARLLGEEQYSLWRAIGSELGPGERALAVSHGAVIELGAVALADRLGIALTGPIFGYCEGVRATFDHGAPCRIDLLRVK